MPSRLLTLLLFLAAAAAAAPRWRLQYFYDHDDSTFAIRDLRFSSPLRGIAVGVINYKKSRPKPMSIITHDGGKTWTEVPLKEFPSSLFLLNDSLGWMVTDKGIWKTNESGRTWTKLKNLRDLNRIYFRDEMTGWVSGAMKQFLATVDGGVTWKPVAAAAEPKTNPEYSYYDWIEFANAKQGLVIGGSVPPRHDTATWMDPETLARRREWPSLTLVLESGDGGATWKPDTAPLFGRVTRYRASAGRAVSLARFTNAFQWPSEVNLFSKGKIARVYREKDRSVTDIAWLSPSTVLLAAVEPPGKLYQLPIPGKVHVLTSDDLATWTEMSVDYRAFGLEVLLAVAGANDAWIATDSGQILKLEP